MAATVVETSSKVKLEAHNLLVYKVNLSHAHFSMQITHQKFTTKREMKTKQNENKQKTINKIKTFSKCQFKRKHLLFLQISSRSVQNSLILCSIFTICNISNLKRETNQVNFMSVVLNSAFIRNLWYNFYV